MHVQTTTIHQKVNLPAKPEEVYNILMDSKHHTAFTGAKAHISQEINAWFDAWDSYIEGKNLELDPGKKIVQLWRSNEEGWPEDHYSKITFLFTSVEGDQNTLLEFTQENLPVSCSKRISQGWEDYYWEPMSTYLNKLNKK